MRRAGQKILAMHVTKTMNTHGSDIFKWAKDKNLEVVVLLNFQFPIILTLSTLLQSRVSQDPQH